MSEANVTKGRELALLIRTDNELTFEVIGGVQDRGISFTNPTEETTSSSTTGDYSESEWTGFSQATINISGVADKRTGTTDPATGFNITNFERLLELFNYWQPLRLFPYYFNRSQFFIFC